MLPIRNIWQAILKSLPPGISKMVLIGGLQGPNGRKSAPYNNKLNIIYVSVYPAHGDRDTHIARLLEPPSHVSKNAGNIPCQGTHDLKTSQNHSASACILKCVHKKKHPCVDCASQVEDTDNHITLMGCMMPFTYGWLG
jgi:hypothetical protein